MAVPASLMTDTCSVHRPFGTDAAAEAEGVRCRLTPALGRGRAETGDLVWTHLLELGDEADVRDSCSRNPGANAVAYADGDEVRVPSLTGTRYAVVWVERHNAGTALAFKRAYLLRHEAVWPGP